MPSLKRKIYVLISLLVALLVLLFTSVGYVVYENSIYVDNRNMMTYQGLFIEENELEEDLSELRRGGLIAAYRTIEELPKYVEQAFEWQNMEPYELYERALKNDEGKNVYVYALAYPLPEERGNLYIISEYETVIENLMDYETSMFYENATNVVLAVGVMIGAVILFFWLLYSMLLKPIRAMSDWLENSNDDIPYNQIKYRELISVAESHQRGVKAQKEMLDREEFFLSSMSHELRTPIAIISSSVELLERLKLEQRVAKVNGRISYAIKNMEYLVKTLLWLSRKNTQPLVETNIKLSQLLLQVVQDNQYLLSGREANLSITKHLDDEYETSDNYGAIYLVLVNLVRNALQHSGDGEVVITQQNGKVAIQNPIGLAEHSDSEESYGYGLFLVEKICAARDISFQFSKDSEQVVSEVRFESR